MRASLALAFSAVSMVALVALAGCGGATTDDLFSSDGGVTGSDGGVDDAGHHIILVAPVYADGCPSTAPANGSPCTAGFGLTCEYGSDPHCTTTASCASETSNGGFVWFVNPPDPSCGGNPSGCPATFGSIANGSACPVSATCSYPEGRCGCGSCATNETGRTTEWECERWESPVGCAEPRPLLGTVCSDEGVECDYGPACCGSFSIDPAMVCRHGAWTEPLLGCDCAENVCGAQ